MFKTLSIINAIIAVICGILWFTNNFVYEYLSSAISCTFIAVLFFKLYSMENEIKELETYVTNKLGEKPKRNDDIANFNTDL